MTVTVLTGDCLEVLRTLPSQSAHTCVSSPPYWGLRDYQVAGQFGLESTPDAYVAALVDVFREVRRVLRDDGTVWLNLGDSYAAAASGRTHPNDSNRPSQDGAFTVPSMEHRQQRWEPKNYRGRAPAGLKPKDLVGIPWRVAFALQADGWYLRSDIIWSKPNPMPESVTDRPTKAHEYIFLLAKSERYYYDAAAIREQYAESTLQQIETAYAGISQKDYEGAGVQDPSDTKRRVIESIRARVTAGEAKRADLGEMARTTPVGRNCGINLEGRNKRSVWTVTTKPYSGAHFATFPPDLIEPCILAGCPVGGTVLDPFGGAGTTGLVADRHQRNAILIELNPEYADMARNRVTNDCPLFTEVA